MNCLKSYIDEQIRTIVYEDGVVATPGNTMGMGNPMAPTDTTPGSEPIVVGSRKKRKNTKNKICTKIKESLLDDDDKFYGSNSDKKIIEGWIHDNYRVTGELTISDDFVVNCTGHIVIKNKSITALTNGLFRWAKVDGDFHCSGCKKLKSLEGGPENVGGSFDCSHCGKLTSLEGSPKDVQGTFDCSNCGNLKSLEGAPRIVGESFYCDNCNKLTTLKGAPEKVIGYFDCSNCKNLKSLEGGPKEVMNSFWCSGCNNLTSLEGAPKKVCGGFYCNGCNNLTSLEGAPKEVGWSFVCSHCDNLTSLEGAPKEVGWSFDCDNCPNLKITDSDRGRYGINHMNI